METLLGQVVKDAAPHNPAADDDYFSNVFHVMYKPFLSATAVLLGITLTQVRFSVAENAVALPVEGLTAVPIISQCYFCARVVSVS